MLPLGITQDEYDRLKTLGCLAEEIESEQNDSEDEGIDDYKVGGYHPVFVGECLIGRYVVLQKLGWGHFSTVWLCRDLKYDTYVAIKLQKSASHYLEAAFDEVEILQKAVKHSETKEWYDDLRKFDEGSKKSYSREDCYTVQLMNAFIYQGPYGKHFCMVFEILGVNLLEIIKRYKYKGIPINICRKMTRQILIGLHYLHKHCGIIHTDLKPENVMLCLSEEELTNIMNHKLVNRNEKTSKRMNDLKKKIDQLKEDKNEKIDEEKKKEDEQELKPNLNDKEKTEDSKETEIETIVSEENDSEKKEVELNDMKKHELDFSKKSKIETNIEPETKEETDEKQETSEKEKEKLIDKIEIKSSMSDDSESATNKSKEEQIQKEVESDSKESKMEEKNQKNSQTDNDKDDIEESKNEIKTEDKKMTETVNEEKKEENKVKNEEKKEQIENEAEEVKSEETKEDKIIPEKKIEMMSSDKKEKELIKEKVRFNEDAFDLNVGLGKNFKVKIADLGNGCWTHYHFQPEIQTRQYRGPEVILGINYNETADLWSLACMIFELLTGDFLFDPKKSKEFKKNDDHLAQMVELLNEFPTDWCTIGTHSKRYFTKNGKLKKIKSLRFWGLKDILIQRYKFDLKEAQALEDFLLPMLRVKPQDRASAADMINHYWLDMPSKSFKSKTPIFKHKNDTERFNVIINQTDLFADVSKTDFEDNGKDDEEDDNKYLIEGKTD
jgi:serine/threonine protein kinase